LLNGRCLQATFDSTVKRRIEGSRDIDETAWRERQGSDDRRRLYERVRTPEMWDTERYLTELIEVGFKIRRVEDWAEHVAASYTWARERTIENREELEAKVGKELVERTLHEGSARDATVRPRCDRAAVSETGMESTR